MRVIRLLSAGTVDENILALQKRKKVLGAKLLDGHHSVGLAHGRGAAADDGPEDLRVMNEILREALEAPDADADADADANADADADADANDADADEM